MVTIRLARGGAKKKPFYSIVVADQRRAPRGRFIEKIGFFDPRAAEHGERLKINRERADFWLTRGALPSERVKQLLKVSRASAPQAPDAPPSVGDAG